MIVCFAVAVMNCLRLSATLLALVHPALVHADDNDAIMATYRNRTQAVRPCDRSGGGIVVCGNRAERNARERLPLPRESSDAGPLRGDAPRASAAPVRQGSCGVTGGQGGGCVGGLSVFKLADVLAKDIVAIVDPDADLSPPPPLPDRFNGTGQR